MHFKLSNAVLPVPYSIWSKVEYTLDRSSKMLESQMEKVCLCREWNYIFKVCKKKPQNSSLTQIRCGISGFKGIEIISIHATHKRHLCLGSCCECFPCSWLKIRAENGAGGHWGSTSGVDTMYILTSNTLKIFFYTF